MEGGREGEGEGGGSLVEIIPGREGGRGGGEGRRGGVVLWKLFLGGGGRWEEWGREGWREIE